MCLNPITIKNPKKRISLSGGMPFSIQVPCGECAECKELKRTEWYYRTYYEAMSCFDSNGYVLFDTLTYRDEELPHVSEFIDIDSEWDASCFDVEDYRLFFVRLRMALQREIGWNPAHCLKYFLTSEYGTDDRYTHRPHYHVLFFVRGDENGRRVDPLVLSKLINKCWMKGRTDGIDYKPYKYVMNHVWSKMSNYTLHSQ